ncbi:MAG: winged helix-turn-helix transcriptional regulator [Verrucomicrobia bacterium]|nr:winged helix-turn-helix transcriptional regulator [Verrucomicrobiota bacterium]MBV8279550.1 winged helix-turn-helix transcriptional regulator [Verrucomicrobiota bacterium]
MSDAALQSKTRQKGHDVFAAIGDSTRRRLLDLLAKGEMPAGEIAAPFAISRPAISQHLTILRDAGLVSVRKKGREQIYSLCAVPIREVYDWAEHYQRFWPDRLSALGKHLDQQP